MPGITARNGELWDEIFRAGTHRDMAGNERHYSESDLDRTVAAYNPSEHEAPLVIGHPRTDAPAYGWVEKLQRVGKSLYAKYRDVAPELVDMARIGRYRKKSVKFYPDGSLRHVGYLGAQPPAIKGLANLAFADSDQNGCFEFSETNAGVVHRLFQGMRDLLISKFDLETADRVTPQWDIDNIEVEPPVAGPVSAFAEGANMSRENELEQQLADERKKSEQLGAQFAEAQGKLDTVTKECATLKQAAVEDATRRRQADNRAFCEGLVKDGRMRPCDLTNALSFMETLSTAGEMEYAEGEGKTSKKPALDAFKAHLAAQPKVVEFGEHAPGAPSGAGDAAGKLDVMTREKLGKNPQLSYALAFGEVQRENPELAREYQQDITQ